MRRINQRAMSRIVIWFLGITSSRSRPKANGEKKELVSIRSPSIRVLPVNTIRFTMSARDHRCHHLRERLR